VNEYFESLTEKGKAFFIMYGQTEATARMAWLDPAKLPQKSSYIGKAIPGGEFCLQDELQQTITDNGVSGELVYRGPNIMLGYANSAQDIQQFFPPDVLLTGDMAVRDNDGEYFIVGRIKRFVKIFGLRINLDDVEKLLEKQGYAAKVVGTDKRLYIALNQMDKEKDAIQSLTNIINLHPSVIRASYVANWPVKSNQKTDYATLLALFEDDSRESH
jgi:acyl-coenzyme A synthetase/AMP-(fatty) acid ligase